MDAAEFYDALAERYHTILAGDWWNLATWQGEVISGLLARNGITPPQSLWTAHVESALRLFPWRSAAFRSPVPT